MTLDEARRILGLAADEDPAAHLAEFTAARNRIAELVRTAPNETLALRYQDGLVEFERALAALREELDKEDPELVRRREWMAAARGSDRPEEPAARPPADSPAASPPAAVAPAETTAEALPVADEEEPEDLPRPSYWEPARVLSLLLILAVALGGGGALWLKVREHQRFQLQERLTFLETLGAKMIDARQWPEADLAYDEIERLKPGARSAIFGRRSIEAGMEEERRQFVAYWSGEATAAFELGRTDDAAKAARMVLEKYPKESKVVELLRQIEQARSTQAREALVNATTAAIQKRRWDEADSRAKELATAFPGDPEVHILLAEIKAGRDKETRDRARARELFAAAKVRDQGQFDQNALEWLREAAALAPEDPDIAALFQKMASYTRTLQVPGDFATLAEAVAAARDRDRIVVGEGTWTGPVIIDKAITLEGAGRDKTIVEVEAAVSTAATFGRRSSGARVSGITFRHRGFDAGPDRFSALLVRGAELTMSDCRVADSAGHGLAVVEAGRVVATRCLFENNGWDGVAVRGAGSRIEFTECESTGNFGHGYDLWDAGSGAIHRSIARDNSGNGILVDTTAEDVVIGDNELRANREYGIVVSAAASGRVHGNRCHENLLGGMAVRFSAARLIFENNKLEKNAGPGLALEQGLRRENFSTNPATGNGGKDIVLDADFSSSD
jgi:tetratricopeptide (TPR) repeat protein